MLPALVCLFVTIGASSAPAEEAVVGKRPYEMVWANRTEDDHPATVDFEDLEGWTVAVENAAATFERSREQQLWGEYVGRLTYRREGAGRPKVTVQPPKPVPMPRPFDCVNLWVYGNNWAWAPDRNTPPVTIRLLLASTEGARVTLTLGTVRWKEWWLMHRKLTADQAAALRGQVSLTGFEVVGGRNADDRTLYFDNFSAYQEVLKPLSFEPRPKRGVDLFPGQTVGTNTGPGRLPFPTREETLLPDNLTSRFTTQLAQQGAAYVFTYRGDDGTLQYRYEPKTGTLSDLTGEFVGRGQPFRPVEGGGVLFASTKGPQSVSPKKMELLASATLGETVVATWRAETEGRQAEVQYTFRLWQKSLVVDVRCLGGEVSEVRFGKAAGLQSARLVNVPYLTFASSRPAVVVAGPVEQPLFLSGWVDWYRSNASALFAVNEVADDGVTFNGGCLYKPKTDGRRNDCFERLFLTVSPRFEEVLPNLPNPKSPWMHVAGERLWRAHGASNRERDYRYWEDLARYGMTKVVITDHETGWRDGGESFTFRTKAAPGKGGDEGQREYARKIQDLGFVYGLYNNYTDLAPVNEYWDEDLVSRHADGQWQTAWARCYAPKPSRAVEYEAKLAPIIQQKFHLSTAYCDVHTAVTPWSRTDYDARVPGAGTFAATFYAYGEIMLHQKKTWGGPVYSEGRQHWYYCGLTDGNYAQDPSAKLPISPWLVDFDLRKLHPLCCNFGMGNPGMFYGKSERLGNSPEQRDRRLDRFLAATLAFGHTGFLVREGGIGNTCRSYFMLQQIHKHYARETAKEIRYGDGKGKLLEVSAAVATGAFQRSQVATRYSNGLLVVVNGNPTERWQYDDGRVRVDLPPNGYYAVLPSPDGRQRELLVASTDRDGRRLDYADTPAYLYADGRGAFTRFAEAACDGATIAHRLAGGALEVIPVPGCREFAVRMSGSASATAEALDKERKPLGPAAVRFSRGLVYPQRVEGAFSYRLTPAPTGGTQLQCDRDRVVPGERVVVRGKQVHPLQIPPESKVGERLWRQFEGAWIDFTVAPLAKCDLSLTPGGMLLKLKSLLAEETTAEAALAGQTKQVRLAAGEETSVLYSLERPADEEVRLLELRLTAGDLQHQQKWWLKAERQTIEVAPFAQDFKAGQRLRGADEKPLDVKSRAGVYPQTMSCGDESKTGVFMHPPYVGGVGYAFALYEPVALPARPPAVFRCSVGKRDGSDPGDGILFRVAVVDSEGVETLVAEKQWSKHAWTTLEADLARWAGQHVRIKLIADVGPNDNSSGDWSCWADMRLESRDPVLSTTLHDHPVHLLHEQGPFPVQGLTLADLQSARRGWLHYRALGLQCGGQYVTTAVLNGKVVGPLPASRGNEAARDWGQELSVALPVETLRALRALNTLTLKNPGGDNFAIRELWLELELADGRRCSSQVHVGAYTQPPTWPYAVGTGVPLDQELAVQIRFGSGSLPPG